MITEPTVFVLGAGASKPYGYPTGEDLRDQILTNFKNEASANSFMVKNDSEFLTGYEDIVPRWDVPASNAQKAAMEFVERFDESHMSIDIFLARHRDNLWLSRMGKLAIILRIFAAEQQHKRKGVLDEKQNWYKLLLRELLGGIGDKDDFIERFKLNNATIITFNYDRSLDHTLFNAFYNGFDGITTDEVIEQMKHVPIIHMHGQVMNLPWQELVPQYGLTYGSSVNAASAIMSRMIENIQIAQDPYENPDHAKVKTAMAKAKYIFFLGFGYDPDNLAKLALSEVRLHGNIIGTAYGLRGGERGRARGDICECLKSYDNGPLPQIELAREETDCMLLLRDNLP